MKLLIAAGATILVAGGCIMAFPGEVGHHMAGMFLIAAGLQCAAWLAGQGGK